MIYCFLFLLIIQRINKNQQNESVVPQNFKEFSTEISPRKFSKNRRIRWNFDWCFEKLRWIVENLVDSLEFLPKITKISNKRIQWSQYFSTKANQQINIFNKKIFFRAPVVSTVVSTVATVVLDVSTLAVEVIVVASGVVSETVVVSEAVGTTVVDCSVAVVSTVATTVVSTVGSTVSTVVLEVSTSVDEVIVVASWVVDETVVVSEAVVATVVGCSEAGADVENADVSESVDVYGVVVLIIYINMTVSTKNL